MKYTPTTIDNKQELRKDIKVYTRKLWLTEYFYDPDNNDSSNERNNIVKNKSKLNPEKGRYIALDSVRESLENLPLNASCSELRKNYLSKEGIVDQRWKQNYQGSR